MPEADGDHEVQLKTQEELKKEAFKVDMFMSFVHIYNQY